MDSIQDDLLLSEQVTPVLVIAGNMTCETGSRRKIKLGDESSHGSFQKRRRIGDRWTWIVPIRTADVDPR